MMKKIKNTVVWLFIIVILVLTSWMMIPNTANVIIGHAKHGTLDLSGWTPNNVMDLRGEWQFYDGLLLEDLSQSMVTEFRNVPHVWNHKESMDGRPYGVASYRLHITGLDPEINYGVQVIDEVSAYRLVINGRDIIKNGNVAYDKKDYSPQWKEKVGFFRSNSNGHAEVLIEIANFSYNYGGFWKTIKIGEASTLSEFSSHQKSIEMFLFSSIIMLGLFFMGVYSISKEFKSPFYFSIFCILIAVRVILKGHRQIYDLMYEIPWDLAVRIEFLTGYLLLPVFGLFIYSLNYTEKKRYTKWFFGTLMLVSFLIMIFTPNEIYANLLSYYIKFATITALYFGYVLWQGFRKRRKGAILMLISYAGLFATVLYDFYGNGIYELMPYGTFFMIVFFSFMMIMTFFEIMKKNNSLEEIVSIDSLTGLCNRFYLNTLLDQRMIIWEHHRLFILFLDLNKFKYINDTYGHHVGDKVLIEAGRRIKACFKETDIICRYGGDEFIVFTQIDSHRENIQLIANRIIKDFSKPFIIDGNHYSIGVSVGVSEYCEGDELKKIIKKSDKAMYQAKKSEGSSIQLMSQ